MQMGHGANQFKIQNDALYETLRVSGAFALAIRGLALSEAMPLAKPLEEKALRCANKIQN